MIDTLVMIPILVPACCSNVSPRIPGLSPEFLVDLNRSRNCVTFFPLFRQTMVKFTVYSSSNDLLFAQSHPICMRNYLLRDFVICDSRIKTLGRMALRIPKWLCCGKGLSFNKGRNPPSFRTGRNDAPVPRCRVRFRDFILRTTLPIKMWY